MKEDSAWQRIRVLLSGSEVPGEGEHKIMLFIRNMKMQHHYDANIRHCVYGLDADLIFLALVSHEPHFFLLREEVVFGQPQGGRGQGGKLPRKVLKNVDEFQLLHISLLRDYLHLEFLPHAAAFHWPGGYDQERLIDDWVLLAYLCGNDFLPHLPTLDIGEGGLDTLFRLYKDSLPELDGYITEHGTLHSSRIEVILRKMGRMEEEVFQKRLEEARDMERREQRQRKRVKEIAPDEEFEDEEMKMLVPPTASPSPSPSSPSLAAPYPDPVSALPAVTEEDTGATIKQRYYHDKFPQFYDASLAASHPELFDCNPVPTSAEEHRRSLVSNYLEGLMWIQRYYYVGVPSWKWYFRYRYAPLASDMTHLSSIQVAFKLGQPFRPLEQLLGVLPPASRGFLPPAYRELMVGDSVIADFYPLQFAVDMNGKRNPWEGIALIPFIEERRLLDAVHRIDATRLSVTEKLRNVRVGDEYMYEFDASNTDSYPATLPAFPPISECHSKVSVWTLPAIPLSNASISQAASLAAVAVVSHLTTQPSPSPSPMPSRSPMIDLHTKPLADYEAQELQPLREEGDFMPTVPKGCRRPYPGFPSLLAVRTVGELKAIGVTVFGNPSRKDTLVLKVNEGLTPVEQQMAQARQWVGQRVWVDWPYLREAEVVSVTDGRRRITEDGELMLTSALYNAHLQECRYAQNRQQTSRGVDTSDVLVLLSVRAFSGMRRHDDGSLRKTFDVNLTVPFQLVVSTNPAPDERWVEQPAPTLASAFPIGSSVIYIGGNHYGAMATITAHTSTVPGRQQVTLSITVPPPNPPFGHQIAQTSKLQFYPSYMVARSLDLHPLILSKVTSSIFMTSGYVDLGLKLKVSKQAMQVPEYARRMDSWVDPTQKRPLQPVNGGGGGGYDSVADTAATWEFSEKAVALLAAYKKRFPSFFLMLHEHLEEYKYSPTWLSRTGSAKEGEEAMKEIADWLTTVGIAHLILVPCSSQMMADRGVKAVETETARLHAAYSALNPKLVTLENVPLLHLYPPSPAIAWSPTEYEQVELGDRVLSVRSDASVPLGLRGVVVGIHGKWCEVVWDAEFMSGNSLNNRCHPLRGQTLATSAFLNLSKPKVLQLQPHKDNAAAKAKAKEALAALGGGGKKHMPPASFAAAASKAPPTAAAQPQPALVSKLAKAAAPASAAASTTAAATTQRTKAEEVQKAATARPVKAVSAASSKAAAPSAVAPVVTEEKKSETVNPADNDLVAMWQQMQLEVQANSAASAPPPATASTSASPYEAERASLALKQMLHVGEPPAAPPAVATPFSADPAAAPVYDPLADKVAQSRARKAAAAAQFGLPPASSVAAAYAAQPPPPQPHFLPQQMATFSQPMQPMYYPPPPMPYAPSPPMMPVGDTFLQGQQPMQASAMPPSHYPQPQAPPPHFYPNFAQGGGRGGGGAGQGRGRGGGRGGGVASRGGHANGGAVPSSAAAGAQPEQRKWQAKPSSTAAPPSTGDASSS